MQNSIIFILALAFGLLISIAGLDPAAARPRVTILQCIGNYNQCWTNCINNPLPPVNGSWQNCFNQCDANHAACINLAFSNPALNPPPPPKKPPHRVPVIKSQ